MFQAVRNTLVLVVAICSIATSAYALDRYKVDVKANHYQYSPYSSTSTYDIDVRRVGVGIIKVNPGLPVEARLADVSVGGRMFENLRLHSQSERDDAEANLLNAQAELIRFQLREAKREAKKQTHQRSASVADVAAALILANLRGVDFETAGIRYLRAGGDPEVLSDALVSITRRAKEIIASEEKGKRKLARVLKLNDVETKHLRRKVNYYQSKYSVGTRRATMMYLLLDRGLRDEKAHAILSRINY